jgi:hypothetical protein
MDISPSPVPWSRISAFVRQLGHDIRNDLNALSLEAALLKELVTDPEAIISANRIQTQLREIASRLKDLSGRYALPAAQITKVTLAELAVQLQSSTEGSGVEWEITDSSAMVSTDAVLLARAFGELTQNVPAKDEAKPKAVLQETPGGALLILREAGGAEHAWPDVPFSAPKAGRYGAGLPIAAAIFKGLGANVEQTVTDGVLETRISLPAA